MLGNGFDLAHYLPTAYVHFMDAMMVIESCEESQELRFDDLFHTYIAGECSDRDKDFFSKTEELYKTADLRLSIDTVKDLQIKLKDNGWFQHFKHHLTDVDTWIDFENEIQSLLVKTCDLFEMSFDDKTIGYFSESKGIYFPNRSDSHKLTIKATDVLANNYRQVNRMFFDSFKLQKMFVQNTLRNFQLITDIYYKAEDVHNPNGFGASTIQHSEICESEFEKLQELDSSYSRRVAKKSFKNVIDTNFLKKYSGNYLEFEGSKVLKQILNHLNDFNDIFKMYIKTIVNELKPIKEFKRFGELGENLQAIFTFNYSNSFERLYPDLNLLGIKNVQYVHGSTVSKKIVLGISDLEDERLRKYKVYGFVKTHQKLINNTDYQFLDHEDLDIKRNLGRSLNEKPYEIIFWGHSLADSDAEYIRAVFDMNNDEYSPNIKLRVWCFENNPHEPLANLIHIASKAVIERWMKKGWLVFEAAPDINAENNKEGET
ncbi:AbiH family protein [Psychrobacter sp. DAB_AL43B]|uniref:AbiH family protein n=1 Tax=Psychrobacter sp. DAB_AL43B TaxID=1028416 RepID=UPI00155773A0|nr:AbiH family protein [Psychrobacter sp. DAB_AL43B]